MTIGFFALGLAIGIAFGYISQRGRFCMRLAFYELATGRAPDMLRAYLLAVLVEMVAVNSLGDDGALLTAVPPFFGLATALGGFLFGWGMDLAMGCAGAILYRAGEGKLDFVFSVLAYAVGAWTATNWLEQPIRALLGGGGMALTLNAALTLDRRAVIVVVILMGIFWILRGQRHPYFGGWDWTRTGFLLGLVGVVAWGASALAGHPTGLGALQGSRNLTKVLLEQNLAALDWSFFVVAGIPLGSFVASLASGRSPNKPLVFGRIPQAVMGGLFMGFGATIGGGDNILHGLSGVPLLAVSSMIFMVCAFAGLWVSVRVSALEPARILSRRQPTDGS